MARGSRLYGHVVSPDGGIAGRVRDLMPAAGAVSIKIDAAEWDRLAKKFAEAKRISPAAIARALNRAADASRTAQSRALVKQTGLKYGVIRKALSIKPASAGNLTAVIVARGGYVPLKEFGARQTRKGVSAAPWGVRRVFPSTFIVRAYGGHVYKRAGAPRFPIYKLFGPAIPVEFGKDASAAAFHATVPAILEKRLAHELARILK